MSETASTEREAEATESRTERLEDLRAQIDLLSTENERLRNEYSRARQASYRQTARGLAFVGIVAVLGGVLFPAAREVLFVLGAIGIFGGLLTRYLTPERFVAAETGERIYTAQADTLDGLAGQLGLETIAVYVPVDREPPVRLFVPQHAEYEIPDEEALGQPLVVGETSSERGASLVPTGSTLFREFERSLTGSLGTDASTVVEQVVDALIENFELARAAEVSLDIESGRATVVFSEAVYGDAERMDNPLGSLLAVAVAESLSQPVRLETARRDDELVITCRWEADAGDQPQ